MPRLSFVVSGWRDSNSRPPAPKAGALTGLRYAPKILCKFKSFIRLIQIFSSFLDFFIKKPTLPTLRACLKTIVNGS